MKLPSIGMIVTVLAISAIGYFVLFPMLKRGGQAVAAPAVKKE